MHTKDTTGTREKEKLLLAIREMYLREGFYKTSMDSIASRLQVSKKTIYKYWTSKDELVKEVAFGLIKEVGGKVDVIIKLDADAFTKLYTLFELFGDTILKFSDRWLFDLRTHTPKVWDEIDEFRTKKLFAVMSQLLEQGKNEGLIADIPFEIMVTTLVSSVRAIVNPDFLYHSKFSYKEAIRLTFEIFFKGILTTTGRKQFKISISEDKK